MLKKSLESVVSICLEKGFEFLDIEYSGSRIKHNFRCLKHGEVHPCAPTQIFTGHGLVCCRHKTEIHLDFEKIKDDFLKRGFEFITKKFSGVAGRYEIKCLKHNQTYNVNINNMLHRGDGLRCCQKEKVSGKNSNLYNPKLTEEERAEGRLRRNGIRIWRNNIFKRDNYTCQICLVRGGHLNAHHIFNWKDNLELRVDLNNGITLCKKCHKIFHKKYGVRKNNMQQWLEFKYENDIKIKK